jgi:flagellar protein FliO/FliZ
MNRSSEERHLLQSASASEPKSWRIGFVRMAQAWLTACAGWQTASAQTQAPPPTGPSLTPLLLGLLLVVALIPIAAWLLRRAGLAQSGNSAGLRVVAQLPLGPRDRVVIIEVGDRRWLLGVSASGIQRLGTLPAGSDAGVAPPATTERSFADIFRRFGSLR